MSSAGKSVVDPRVMGPYAIFILLIAAVRSTLRVNFSSLLTLSAGFTCLGLVLLLLKVQKQRSVSGLSAKTLLMYGFTLFFRLCSTMIRNGYLPVDQTGDGVYQTIEIVSLSLVCFLGYCMLVSHAHTYQYEHDTMPGTRYLIVGAFLLAMLVHPNLNRRLAWDVCWTAACYVETMAMFPQLWMLTKRGGEVDGLTSHFVVLMNVARLCSFYFWYCAYSELKPKAAAAVAWHMGYNVPGAGIIGAHLLQLLLSMDFLYMYFKSVIRANIFLPGAGDRHHCRQPVGVWL